MRRRWQAKAAAAGSGSERATVEPAKCSHVGGRVVSRRRPWTVPSLLPTSMGLLFVEVLPGD